MYLIAYGPKINIASFPVFGMKMEHNAPLIALRLGEPGVKRGMPGVS